GQIAQPEALEAAGQDAAHLRLDQGTAVAQRLGYGGGDHVRQHLWVVRVDQLRVDTDLDDLPARERRLPDHSATRPHSHLRRLLLEALELLLHLHRLCGELLEVHRHYVPNSSASKVRFINSTISSSVAGRSSSSTVCSGSSPRANTSESLRPVTS